MEDDKQETTQKKNIIKKWWFLIVIILLIISNIVFIAILINSKKSNCNISDIQKRIYNINNSYSLYANDNTLILLGENLNDEKQENLIDIINVLESNKNTKLKNYKTLICIDFLSNEDKTDYLVLRQKYSLPDFKQLGSRKYIDFDDYNKLYATYKDLYSTYDEAMNSYTDLFMSIGR